jgi:acyl carrier protein
MTSEALIDLLTKEQIIDTDLPITPDADLFSLGLDSIAMMALLLQIEERFGISVSPEAMRREIFATPKALSQFLSDHEEEIS